MEYSAEGRAPRALSNPGDLFQCQPSKSLCGCKRKALARYEACSCSGKRSTSRLHRLPRNNSLDALRRGFGLFVVHKENGASLWDRTSASSGKRMIPMPSRRPWQQEKPGTSSSSRVSGAGCNGKISSSEEASSWYGNKNNK